MRIPIGKVDSPDELLEMAFHKARKVAGRARGTIKGKPRFVKSRALELTKISAAIDVLVGKLEAIVAGMPHLNQLAPFYQELVRYIIDPDEYKQALGATVWASGQLKKIARQTRSELRRVRDIKEINRYRTAAYGRAASVLKQIKNRLASLEKSRRALKELPAIKTDLPTVVIAGYPNIGKSTLLRALTGSTPEIAPYPFTTKQLMLGYTKDVQYIDTPGLLDRPFAKRKPVEKQAILALRHLATLIVFVIDPTEACGYGLPQQVELLQQVKALFKRPVLVVLTKIDLASSDQIAEARQAVGREIMEVDTTERASVERLLSAIERSVHAARTASASA
jgi:nucleolar GTP-binding protein